MITKTSLKPNLIKKESLTYLPPKETTETNTQQASVSFQLKGRLFTLSVLQIQNTNTIQLDKEFTEKIKLAPNFLQNAPVVIDVSQINE